MFSVAIALGSSTWCRPGRPTVQAKVVEIVRGLGMEPLLLTIPAQKPVRSAVIPIAGMCPGMWPATKCSGPWLFPIRIGAVVKPAICWLCEELMHAEIEQIILVVNEVGHCNPGVRLVPRSACYVRSWTPPPK